MPRPSLRSAGAPVRKHPKNPPKVKGPGTGKGKGKGALIEPQKMKQENAAAVSATSGTTPRRPVSIPAKKSAQGKPTKIPKQPKAPVPKREREPEPETVTAETAEPAPPMKRRAAETSERVAALHGLDLVKHDACVAMDQALKTRDKTRRAALVEQVHKAIRGSLASLVLKHDASRVAQMLLKNGTPAIRAAVLDELEPHILELSKGTYSSFVVSKLAQYASKDRVIAALRGHARDLLKSPQGWYVIEDIFALRAGAAERRAIIAEFAGGEIAAFAREPGAKPTIAEALAGAPELKRTAVVGRMRDLVLSLATKGHAADATLFHHIVLALFSIAPQPAIEEVATALSEQLVRMAHTREGARVAVRCVLATGAKSRKAMIKSLHGHVLDAVRDQWAHLFVVSLLERVDDTALSSTALVSPLVTAPPDEVLGLLTHKFASVPFLAILSPRNPKYFGPVTRTLLGEGPDAAPSSKKPDAERRAELLQALSPRLLSVCIANAKDLLCNDVGARVLVEAAAECVGDKTALREAVVAAAADTEVAALPCANRAIKHMIQNDAELAAAVAEHVGDEGLCRMATAEGGQQAFVVAAVVANAAEELRERLIGLLGAHRDAFEKSEAAGHKLLLDVLDKKPSRDEIAPKDVTEEAEEGKKNDEE